MCGGPERFYAAGEERAKISFPDGFGYPVNPSSYWALLYMYMNHRVQTDTAYIEYKMTIEPQSSGFQSVDSYWMDAAKCLADPIYNVPGIEQAPAMSCEAQEDKLKLAKKRKKAGKAKVKKAKKRLGSCQKQAAAVEAARPADASHVETRDVTIEKNGWLVAGAGHVHGGAKRLTITKPCCPGNPIVARSDPTWGNPDHPFYNVKPVLHEPGPIGMSAFKSLSGIPVTDGQTIRLNSIYDDLQPHTRVMGIMVLYLAPDPAGGPTPAVCGGAPGDMVYGSGTNLPGRSSPVPFKVPLTGLDANRNPFEIEGPPGEMKTLGTGSVVNVGDRFFSEGNITLQTGSSLTYAFNGNEEHNVTLANGPLGIGSVNQRVAPTRRPSPGRAPTSSSAGSTRSR